MQAKLFDTSTEKSGTRPSANGFRDSAFGNNKELPLHRWVPWIAGFSANFVADCIDSYLPVSKGPESTWVLDAFAGVGTTLVEAYKRGLNVLGFEINPYAALAARLKIQAGRISTATLADYLSAYHRFMDENCPDGSPTRRSPRSRPPEGFSGRTQLFSENVEKRILFTLDFIEAIEDRLVRDLFRLALGSVMVGVSNYSYEPSLTKRSAVGKATIDDAPVTSVVSAKLRLMLKDIEWVQNQMQGFKYWPERRVYAKSCLAASEVLERASFVDLVITSPPYLNNYHYPRNTRPQLHWLGFASRAGYADGRESDSFGKFWQTVRGLGSIELSFRLEALEPIIDMVRHRNVERGLYGGPGWANYIATYFNDTYRFCKMLKTLLKKNGVAIVVIGNSIIQGVEIRTDQFFGEIAKLCGLSFNETLLLREKRTGSSIIQSSVRVDKAAHKTVLYESAIVLSR